MTEQYKDAYQSKYREETAQIHAPLRLIEKTKAAMREEEKRLAAQKREPGVVSAAAQGREPGPQSAAVSESTPGVGTASAVGMQEKWEAMAVPDTAYGNRKRQIRSFSIRKWAYPLSAAAAILILVSVSLTMRGMKSANRLDTASPAAENGAVCEEAAADEGYETAEATALETPMVEFAAGAAESAEDMAETPAAEEAPAADSFTARQSESGVKSADGGLTNGLLREDAAADMAAPAEEMMAEESAENENSERGPADEAPQKRAAGAEKEQMAGEREQKASDQDDFTIEKVTKRPARFSGVDVKIRRYEGKIFRLLETTAESNHMETAWEAYVETAAGEGYVIGGEAESVEDFLAAAHEKLEEEAK